MSIISLNSLIFVIKISWNYMGVLGFWGFGVLGFWVLGFWLPAIKKLKNQNTKTREKTDTKQKEQKMSNEFSVLAPEQEKN